MKYPNNYTAEELVERAVKNARPYETGESYRWVAIQDAFATGMTVSIQICRQFGLDPHERISGPHCLSCNP